MVEYPPIPKNNRIAMETTEVSAFNSTQVKATPTRRVAITRPKPIVRLFPKIGRNAQCPCGSGAKFKKCCGRA